MQFTERTPIEQGFAQVFETDVKPKLVELEFDRQAILRRTRIQSALVIALAIVAGVVSFLIWGEEEGPLIPILIAVAGGYFGAFAVKSRASRGWKSQVGDITMSAICAHLGDLSHSPSGEDFSLDAMIEMKLIPDTYYKTRNNLLRGSYHGTPFSLVHAKLMHEDGSARRDPVTDPRLFEGLLFQVALARPAPGRIALLRDHGGVGNKLAETLSFGGTRSLPKVAVRQADLEREFEVYAENPDAAQDYLTDTMVSVLMRIGYELGQGQGAKSFTAGFDDDTFYLALRRADKFKTVGDLNTPVAEVEADVHQVFDKIALAYHVIDRLNLAFGTTQGSG